MDTKDLQYLVGRLKHSDHEAFRIVFDELQDNIFRFLYFKTRDVQVAEDLLQETFFKLWKNRNILDESQHLRSYVYTIAENLFLNYRRHLQVVRKHEELVQLTGPSSPDTPLFLLEQEEFNKQLTNAIEMLPEKVKDVFLLNRIENLSYQEIADRQSISIKTVESHMVKALRLLREALPIKYFTKKTG